VSQFTTFPTTEGGGGPPWVTLQGGDTRRKKICVAEFTKNSGQKRSAGKKGAGWHLQGRQFFQEKINKGDIVEVTNGDD